MWLKVNGEAIYGSRPAALAAEGPTHPAPKGPGRDSVESPYTAQDIRFTQKDGFLYAIALDWPTEATGGTWVISSLSEANKTLLSGKITEVELLGFKEALDWKRTSKGLVIKAPASKPCDFAYAFRIRGNGIQPFIALAAKEVQR